VSLTTTGSYSGILYFKNDSDVHFHLEVLKAGTTTGTVKFKVIRNPTTGTLISGGTTGAAQSTKFTSAESIDGTIKIGANGSTVTDGTTLDHFLVTNTQYFNFGYNGSIILLPGNSIAIMANPSVSCEVQVSILGYHEEEVV
jgi:hypothetical protein